MKTSAGILLYRRTNGLEVFLVHFGGPLWAKKDTGAWSIPKGEFLDEEPLAAARREFREETGMEIGGEFEALEPVVQAGGKQVFAFALEGNCDATSIQSNLFEMEWPPRSGKRRSFPEADRAAWFAVAEAKERIVFGQRALIEQLEKRFGGA